MISIAQMIEVNQEPVTFVVGVIVTLLIAVSVLTSLSRLGQE